MRRWQGLARASAPPGWLHRTSKKAGWSSSRRSGEPLPPVYLIYPHARSYPAKLRLFAEIIRTDMPNLVGMTHTGTNAPQPAAIAGRPVP